ncbi:MAG TPA: hypothetical protein VHD15_09515 [Hyphomicrobiales bacterium]|nr:hypothetical protein [Hyphomicrobiales bacterium]
MSLLTFPFAAMAAASATGEAVYLNRFDGGWTGEGAVRLAPGTPPVSVSCSLTGSAAGAALTLTGRCGGGLIGSSVSARLAYDAASHAYRGSWSAGGSNATLAGRRHGEEIALDVAAADEPGRHLTLALDQGRLHLSMTRSDDHAEVLRLALVKN